jgi:peptidyl-prolyl cis-trans isomerase C
MRSAVRIGSAVALATAFVASTVSAQQAKPGTATSDKPQAKAPAALPAAPPPSVRIENAKEVLATVNGEPITRGEIIQYLSHFPVPIGKEQEGYDLAMEEWVNLKLMNQFLRAQKVAVVPKELDLRIAEIEESLKKNRQTLADYLADQGISLAELRTREGDVQQWRKFLRERATDGELQKYFNANKDLFDGKMVRASHILIKVPETAADSEREAAKQKLVGIRREIESGKISFADAANKYSQDQDEIKNGGDLDFFPRRGRFDEEFSDTAFALSKGQISQPVLLPEFGWELIQVTDIRPGVPVDFAQIKARVVSMYGYQLQEAILKAQRDKAKITKKPLPKDLYPKVPVEALQAQQGGVGGTAASGTTTGAGAAKQDATPKR